VLEVDQDDVPANGDLAATRINSRRTVLRVRSRRLEELEAGSGTPRLLTCSLEVGRRSITETVPCP
jgi:hypothetical protein